jgi:muconolactone D-isomerase
MEFLVRQINRTPLDEDSQRRREELRVKERIRAQELRELGILVRLWRIPGTQDALGLYEVPDATALHEVLASLPMFHFLQVVIEPLATHPQEQGLRP